MIIDTQTHIFERAFVGIHTSECPWTRTECSAKWLVAEMDRAGVDKSILISYEADDIKIDLCQGHLAKGVKDYEEFDPKLPENGGNIMRKEYYLEALDRYPDKFIWFTAVNLSKPDHWDVLMSDFKKGAKGIKLFPAYYGALPDDERLLKIYKYCSENDVPVIYANERWNFDCYPKLVFPARCDNTTDEYSKLLPYFTKILSEFPNVRFLLTHWGVSTCWFNESGNLYNYAGLKPFIELLNKHHNAYTDVAALAMSFAVNEDYPWPGGLILLRLLIEGAGAEKVMFGSDWPWIESAGRYFQVVNMIKKEASFLNDHEKNLVLGENAAKFLKIKNSQEVY